MKKKLLALFCVAVSIFMLGSCSWLTPEHEHTWATEWTTDATDHWHACTDESCKEITDKAPHSGGTATSEQQAECEVCGKAYGELLELNGGTWSDWQPLN